ncbi:hypothetical protein TSTA_104740 [Talaromyces stipitatus ATCC 10500]|uniref:Uncharacterized protein n=1 Tax=Talaromyces stipitatus (strain ATCC 10500 / CBS 375.48 / QM 6759 / NRRL 1006) TaxID=441959 RepID=B8MP21_TALSN|nr:uncharacterized protein TSTA_104740 [Talaromyces stipitatus ATCC 10500]EED14260.1 hypothetical protein TSTA_104740 [Talaromyces stipitatus ATCC 10500]
MIALDLASIEKTPVLYRHLELALKSNNKFVKDVNSSGSMEICSLRLVENRTMQYSIGACGLLSKEVDHSSMGLRDGEGRSEKGWYNKEVLQTYDSERRAAPRHLLQTDKVLPTVICGQIPKEYKTASTHCRKLFSESRAPDVLVYQPGSHIPNRLSQLRYDMDSWPILLFTGQHKVTEAKLPAITNKLDNMAKNFPSYMIGSITIVAGSMEDNQRCNLATVGYTYYDPGGWAHLTYRISPKTGALVVLRPDFLIGYATTPDDAGSVRAFLANPILAPN